MKCILTPMVAAAVLASFPVSGAPPSSIDPARMSATVKVLASDEFQGRAPGSPGEAKTVDYLVAQFRALGLQPGGERGGWLEQVPLVHNVANKPTRLEVRVGKSIVPLVAGRDVSPETIRPISQVTIVAAPMVFVGYGVSAPERNWDDFKGVDLHGKVAVFLVNDPDFEAKPGEPVAGRFGGRAMTYYGRWTYKFEEAARRGAIAAFDRPRNRRRRLWLERRVPSAGGNYDIIRPAGQTQPCFCRRGSRARRRVVCSPRPGSTLRRSSVGRATPDFRPVELQRARFSTDLPVRTERVESRNVLAKLPGHDHPDETILFAAHWDAFGVGAPDAQGRTIRPGRTTMRWASPECWNSRARSRSQPRTAAHAHLRRLDGGGARAARLGNLRRHPLYPPKRWSRT